MSALEIILNSTWITALLAIVLLFFVSSGFKSRIAQFAVLVNSALFSYIALPALTGNPLQIYLYSGSFMGNIPVYIDGLSAWFILIINFTSLTGVFYGSGYLKKYRDENSNINLHWILFIVFHLSMLWVCSLRNGFAFLIVWEIMSLSSMMLVIFEHNNPKILRAGINYLVQMHISVVFLSVGFIWLYFKTGSFDFSAFQSYFNSNSNILLFLIFFMGFGIKAGFIPLHSWLPHAHPAAPSHVSGVMSGVIVKLGIYGIFRIISFLQSDFVVIGEIVLTVSVLTGLYGILNAAVHRDFKRMLAYCTIENIGIIGIGTGLGLLGLANQSSLLYYLGFGGALLHILNHSLFKSLLFYSAGSVYQQTHTRDMDKLGGLIKTMPKTAFVFLIGSIAIAGIPPFNGFVSEFIIYSGLIQGFKSNDISQISLLVLSLAGLSIIGGVSILTFTKTFGTIFLGSERQNLPQKPKEVPFSTLLPQYIIIGVMLCISFFTAFFIQPISNLINQLPKHDQIPDSMALINYTKNIANLNYFSLLFVGIIGLVWLFRFAVSGKNQKSASLTWGCGYVAPGNRMQYTGKSFSKPLAKLFGFLLIEQKHYQELGQGETFPPKRKYVTHYLDFFEFRFIDPLVQRLIYGANYFKFIQNGHMQWYVLYGIVFIVSVFLLTFLNIFQ
ncbi:MAG: proton-conducting transporter membrane subunit [Bacteroidales bacterium]